LVFLSPDEGPSFLAQQCRADAALSSQSATDMRHHAALL